MYVDIKEKTYPHDLCIFFHKRNKIVNTTCDTLKLKSQNDRAIKRSKSNLLVSTLSLKLEFNIPIVLYLNRLPLNLMAICPFKLLLRLFSWFLLKKKHEPPPPKKKPHTTQVPFRILLMY